MVIWYCSMHLHTSAQGRVGSFYKDYVRDWTDATLYSLDPPNADSKIERGVTVGHSH